ncbi:MAG: hypothetical protein PVH61_00970 [Candidatus Aminicenantes bacterium]
MKKIRIFAAAPQDVHREYECLESLVQQLNKPGEIAGQMGITLELKDRGYHSDSPPGEQEPEVSKYDLFIGILWSKFDPPSGRKSREGSAAFSSAAEEEFNNVYELWKTKDTPRIRLYYCLRSILSMDIDAGSMDRVRLFLDRIKTDNQPTGFYKTFDDITSFKQLLKQDLSDHMREVNLKTLLEKQIKTTPEEIQATDNSLKQLKEGEIKEIVFFGVGTHIPYQSIDTQAIEKIQPMLENHYHVVSGIIKQFNGCNISRDIDGGVWIFWGHNVHNRAVSAGIEIIKKQEDLKGNEQSDMLAEPLKARIAAHCYSIEIRFPFNRMYANAIHYAVHIEKNAVTPGTFVITDSFYNKLDNQLKEKLNYKKDYENTTLYSFREIPEGFRLSENDLDNILNRVKNNILFLLNSLEQNVKLRMDDFRVHESMRSYVETIYENFEYFNRCFSDYDKIKDARKTLSNPVNYIKSLLKEDESLLEKFEELNVQLKRIDMDKPGLLSIKEYVKSIRINSVPYLKYLLHQFERQSDGEQDIDHISRDFLLEKVVDFVQADPFHEDVYFVELFLTRRDLLIDFISTRGDDGWHQRLISRLWQLADFVLIEDRTTAKDRQVFPILANDDKKGSYFKVINRFLNEGLSPTRSEIKNQFVRYKIKPEDSDITIVLKSLLIAHQNREVRTAIIKDIEFKNLWYIIAYSNTTLTVLTEIAEFLSQGEKDEDRMKVFFDLTLLSLHNDIFSAQNHAKFSLVKYLIQVFYKFDFFVEPGYFNRLNDLSMRFAAKSKKFNIDIEIIEDAKKKLDEYSRKRGKPPKTTPKCIHELPLAVQRKFVREGHHIDYFVIHTNPLIASEANRYINRGNIDRFLAYPNINVTLMNMLLRREELFWKKSTVYAAMAHRKCTREFAMKHYHQLILGELKSLANNRDINPSVREFIKSRLQKKIKANK